VVEWGGARHDRRMTGENDNVLLSRIP